MSMFGASRGHNNHLLMEPGYGGPKPAVFSYAASQESYAASTEKVVQYGSPTSMELHKVQLPGAGKNPLLRRVFGQQTHHDRDHRSSPPAVGSPDHNKFHVDSSSPKRDQHHYGKYKNYGDESDDDDEKDVICRDGVCYPKPKNMREEDYERERNSYSTHGNHTAPPHPISHPINPPSYSVPVSVRTKKDDYPSRHTGSKPSFHADDHHANYPSHHTGSKPSFKEDNPHGNYPSHHTGSKPSFHEDPHGNYPSRHTGSKPSFHEDNPHANYPSHHTGLKPSFHEDPHDNYPSRHTGSKPSFHEDDHHANYPSYHTAGSKPSFKEDNPHNSYASPPYAVSTHPIKDPYPRDGYREKPKGGSYSPPSYTASPRKDHSYDATSRPMMYNSTNPLAPVKTKPEHGVHHDGASSPKSPFSPSPRKDHREAIDSMEARRRYGKVSSPMGRGHVEKNVGVIDSQEAARKYNGIFVNF